ncbi:MAG: matrixin family metalloprotease [Deltaproteobacteria bacterium]|nr:matrixin family metalloprotease [Deltaproteobacteria bacterium]
MLFYARAGETLNRLLVAAVMTIVVLPGRAFAYKIATDANGHEAHWPGEQMPLPMRVDPDGTTGLNGDDCIDIARKSMQAWNNVKGSFAGFVYSGFKASGHDNGSILFARKDVPPEINGALAVTLLTFNQENGMIYTAQIVVDAVRKKWAVRDDQLGSNVYDLQSVLTHELGHVFGLDHTPDPTATMYAIVAPGETKKRTLAQDDMDGLKHLYPDNSGMNGSHCTGDEDCKYGICVQTRNSGNICARECDSEAGRDTCMLGAGCETGTDNRSGCIGGTECCRNCGADRECMSGLCANISGRNYCVGICDPVRPGACPQGSTCRAVGDYGWICLPTKDVCPDAADPEPLLIIKKGAGSPGAGSVTLGAGSVTILESALVNVSYKENVVAKGVKIKLLSSRGTGTSVSRLSVYLDANKDGKIDSGDTLAGDFSDIAEKQQVELKGLDQPLAPGQEIELLFTVDPEPRETSAGGIVVGPDSSWLLLFVSACIVMFFIMGRVSKPKKWMTLFYYSSLLLVLNMNLSCIGGGGGSEFEKEYVRIQLDVPDKGAGECVDGGPVETAGFPLESETLTIILK